MHTCAIGQAKHTQCALSWEEITNNQVGKKIHSGRLHSCFSNLALSEPTIFETYDTRYNQENVEKNMCFWSVLIVSCHSHSAWGMNRKCKHHYHFPKDSNYLPLLWKCGLVQLPDTHTRPIIFSIVLTDSIHATLKCPGSCCERCLHCFKLLTRKVEELKLSALKLQTCIDLGLSHDLK